MLQSIPSDMQAKINTVLLTLLVTVVGYIAKEARQMSQQIGRVYRTLFGEDGDGKSGLHVKVQRHERLHHITHTRLTRIEAHLDMPDRRDEKDEEGPIE